jgi:hypothetical protein
MNFLADSVKTIVTVRENCINIRLDDERLIEGIFTAVVALEISVDTDTAALKIPSISLPVTLESERVIPLIIFIKTFLFAKTVKFNNINPSINRFSVWVIIKEPPRINAERVVLREDKEKATEIVL